MLPGITRPNVILRWRCTSLNWDLPLYCKKPLMSISNNLSKIVNTARAQTMGYHKEYKSSNSISATCHTFQTTKLHLWVFTRKNPSVHSSSITLALFRVTAGAGSYPSWNGLLAYQSLILWSWTWRSLSLSSRPFLMTMSSPLLPFFWTYQTVDCSLPSSFYIAFSAEAF